MSHEIPEEILPNIDLNKQYICITCKNIIDTSLKDPITIFSCKNFFHKKCVEATMSTRTESTKPTESAEPNELTESDLIMSSKDNTGKHIDYYY
jgi:hypothetical protein